MAGERVPPETGPASQPFHLVALLSDLRSSLSDVLHSTRCLPTPQRDNYSPPDLDDLEDQIPPPLLRETCAGAADVFLHRQWRLSAAQSFAHAVTATLKQKRQADASWRTRALNNAARAFWVEAASQRCWPSRLAKVRLACEVPVFERPTPDSSPPLRAGTKRLRSPNFRSGREKRRRSNTNDMVVPAVNTRTVTGDASSLVFGLSVADLPATDTVWDSRRDRNTCESVPSEVHRYAQRYIYDMLRPCLGDVEPTSSSPAGATELAHETSAPRPERQPQLVHTRIRVPCPRHRPPNEGLGPVIMPSKAVDTDRELVWANKSNLILSQYPGLLENIEDPGVVWPEKSWCPPGAPTAELMEIVTSKSCSEFRRSAWASRKVVCESVLRVRAVRSKLADGTSHRSLEVVTAKLQEPQIMESTVAIVSPYSITDVGLMAAIALSGWTWPPELASAWTILCRYRQLQTMGSMRLSAELKQRIMAFTKNADELGAIDDNVNVSPLIVQDYAAHVVAKIGEPSEWANKALGELVRFTHVGSSWTEVTDPKAPATLVLPLEALYFVIRRYNREKRRGRAAVEARKSGFDLERALQPTETATAPTVPPVPAVSSRYAGLVSRLPLWASPFRKAVLAPNPRDLWEITLPLLGSFNQFGGALINVADRRSERADFASRFLTAEQVADLHRPILFVRMTRFLPVVTNDVVSSAVVGTESTSLSARCNKVAIGPTSPAAASGSSEAQALCADQMALPTTVCIKAANRTGKTLEMIWDPYEEYYLWRAVADQVRCRFRSSVDISRPIDDEFLDRMHEEMLFYLSQWGAVVKGVSPGGSGILGRGRCWWPRIVHHFMDTNWDFVAHVVNTSVLPFARCRSSEACKAKFISLLFEYVAGGLSLAPPEPLRGSTTDFRDTADLRHKTSSSTVTRGGGEIDIVRAGDRWSDKTDAVAHVRAGKSEDIMVQYMEESTDEPYNVWVDDLWETGLHQAASKAVDEVPSVDHMNFSWIKEHAGAFARVPKLDEMPLGLYDLPQYEDEDWEENALREKLDAEWVDETELGGLISPITSYSPSYSAPLASVPLIEHQSKREDRDGANNGGLLDDSQLQRLMTFFSSVSESAKSLPCEGRGWFSTLEAQVARLQLGKTFSHFKSQGLLSLSAVSALEPTNSSTSTALSSATNSAQATMNTDLTTSEADYLVRLLNLGLLGDQSGRLMKILTLLHSEAEKRKRGQSISHENFVMEKSLRNLIGAPECLALVQAMRDYMQTKGAIDVNQAPPTAVHSQIQQKYHRLLLPICDSQSRWANESLMAAGTLSHLPCYITERRGTPTFLPTPIAPLLRLMALSTSGRVGFDMILREPILYATGHTCIPHFGRLLDLKRPLLPTFVLQPVQARPPTTPAGRRGTHAAGSTSFDNLYIGRGSPEQAGGHHVTPTMGEGASDVSGRGRSGGYAAGPSSSQSKRMASTSNHHYSPQQRSNRPASRPVSILTPPMVPLGGGYYAPQAQPPQPQTAQDRPAVLANPWVKTEAAGGYPRDFTARPSDPSVPPQYAMPPGANMYMHMSGHYQAPQTAAAWPPPSPSGPSQGRGHAPRYMTQPAPHQWGGAPAPTYLGVKGGAYMPQQYTTGPPTGGPASYAGYPSAPPAASQLGDYFGRSGASPSATTAQGQRLPPPMYVDSTSQYPRGPQHRPPPQYYRPPDYSGQVPPPYYDARNTQWRPPM